MIWNILKSSGVANVIDTKRWDIITKKSKYFCLKFIYSLPWLYFSDWPLFSEDKLDNHQSSEIGKGDPWLLREPRPRSCLAGELSNRLWGCLLCVHQIPLPLSCQLLISVFLTVGFELDFRFGLYLLLVFWTLTLSSCSCRALHYAYPFLSESLTLFQISWKLFCSMKYLGWSLKSCCLPIEMFVNVLHV